VLIVVVDVLLRFGPRARRQFAGALTGAIVISTAVVAWWFAYNVRGGSGVFGGNRTLARVAQFVAAPLVANGSARLDYILASVWDGFVTLWASYGWGNLLLPLGIHHIAIAWCAVGAVGALVSSMRTPQGGRRGRVWVLGVLVISFTLVAVLYGRAATRRYPIPGRVLLPALPALCTLIALGWARLLPERIRTLHWAAVRGAVGAIALLAPVLIIRPSYAPPPNLTEADLADFTPVHATFGDFAELAGFRAESLFVDPGRPVTVTLAWRVLCRADSDYTLAVQVFAPGRELLGEVQRYPGRGAFSTSTWEPGMLFSEVVPISLSSTPAEAQMAWIEVSFFNAQNLAPVPVRDAAGAEIGLSLRLERVKLRGTSLPLLAVPRDALRYGTELALVASQARLQPEGTGYRLEVGLDWMVRERPQQDYTISLQLRDHEDRIVAQKDSEPRDGMYPTSFWERGEIIHERRVLSVPALNEGTYTLYLCVYDLATMQRLPIYTLGGVYQPNKEATLLTIGVQGGMAPQLRSSWPSMVVYQ